MHSTESSDDIRLEGVNLSLRPMHRNDTSVAVDEELLEVPLELAGSAKTRVRLQVLVDGVSVRTVDLTLAHDGKLSRVFITDELGNVGVALRLLGTKLVAREANDFKALVSELRMRLD